MCSGHKKKSKRNYPVCFRCSCFLEINGTEKCDLIKFESSVGGAILSCERGYIQDSIADKHEIFS